MIEVGDLVQLTGKSWHVTHKEAKLHNEIVLITSLNHIPNYGVLPSFERSRGTLLPEILFVYKGDGYDYTVTIISKVHND